MICSYCGEEYAFWMTHARLCSKYKEYKEKVLSKEYLEEQYVKEERSVKDIAEKTGLSCGVINRKLRSYGIHIRNSHETRFSKGYIENTKATCREKFGADYANSKESSIFGKAEEAIFKEHGVRNNFQRQDCKQKIKETFLVNYGFENASSCPKVKQKRKNTFLTRYGYSNPGQVPEFINKQKLSRRQNNSSCYNSPLANNFFSRLLENIKNTEHIYYAKKGREYCVMSKDKELYFYDFVDTDKKKCIEFNGNYWHANPQMYKEDWVNPHSHKTAKQIWERDKKKVDTIKQERNYDVLIIWEKDINEDINREIQKCIQFLND